MGSAFCVRAVAPLVARHARQVVALPHSAPTFRLACGGPAVPDAFIGDVFVELIFGAVLLIDQKILRQTNKKIARCTTTLVPCSCAFVVYGDFSPICEKLFKMPGCY